MSGIGNFLKIDLIPYSSLLQVIAGMIKVNTRTDFVVYKI